MLRAKHALGAVVLVAIALLTPKAFAENSQRDQLNDGETVAAIRADIDDAERLSADSIKVEMFDGLVTLSGTVESLLDKQLAVQIAKRTRGVKAVVDQILVASPDRSDKEIRDDVAKVLRINDAVDKPRIAVGVTQGEVAMIGKVESLAEKRIAEFAASGVRGVTSVNNQLTVSLSDERSDDELRDEIHALMVQSVYLDDADVDVRVIDHVVKLSGSVGSVEVKDHLERLAEVWGVIEVDVSGISVNPQLANGRRRAKRYADVTDPSIQTALERSFRADPIVFSHAANIETSAESGKVTLNGTVSGLPIKQRAERLAMDVIGVHQVVNELQVETPQGLPGDAEIIRETQEAIERSAYLDRHDLRVHCEAAHVSLYGVVDSETERQVAEWIANGVQGVVHVNNALTVEKPWKEKSDADIKRALERKLKFVLFDTSNQVTVDVEDGVAILRGEVDTWRQWQAALDLAIEAGAKTPHNLIRVRFHPPHGASRIYVPR